MFRVGLQVLNSFILTESVVSFQTLTTRGRESANTRYLTTHSGGSWFTPWMPTILYVVFCGFPRQKANAGIDPSFPQT